MSAAPTPTAPAAPSAAETDPAAWCAAERAAGRLVLDLARVNAVGELLMAARFDERVRAYLVMDELLTEMDEKLPDLLREARAAIGEEGWATFGETLEAYAHEFVGGLWAAAKGLRDGAHFSEVRAPGRVCYPVAIGVRLRAFAVSELEARVATAATPARACELAAAGDPWAANRGEPPPAGAGGGG
jgi:hypothetical protein